METLTHAPVLARFGYAVSDPTRARILLAVLMSASTIVVALNAQLLRRVKLNPSRVR